MDLVLIHDVFSVHKGQGHGQVLVNRPTILGGSFLELVQSALEQALVGALETRCQYPGDVVDDGVNHHGVLHLVSVDLHPCSRSGTSVLLDPQHPQD